MPRTSPGRLRRCALLASAVATVFPACARATNWIDGNGNWSVPGNWSAGVPTNGSTVNITESDGINRVINYDYAGAPVSIGVLTVNLASGGGTAATAVSMSANNLTNAGEIIGGVVGGPGGGTGAFIQTGGVHTDTNALNLGFNAGDNGFYSLGGGTLVDPFFELVGVNGNGTFLQSGGVNSMNAGSLVLGDFATSSGSYALSGAGSLFVQQSEAVGFTGFGSINQSGGTNTISTNLFVGQNAGATGSYTLSGGTLRATEAFVGETGAGVFVQTGGNVTLSAAVSLSVADAAGSTGSYTFGANGVLTAAGYEIIGTLGNGNFAQSAGSNIANGGLIVGGGTTSNGSNYTLTAGSLFVAQSETIGNSGTGSFVQSGGLNFLSSGPFAVGEFASGNYTLSGGSLISIINETIGDLGKGSFNQSGGTNTLGITATFYMGNSGGASGSYLLSGGTLAAPAGEIVGNYGTGSFVQLGGLNTVSTLGFLHIAQQTGSTGSYTLAGGTLTATDQQIGCDGVGTYIQTGGTNNDFGGEVFVFTLGSLNGIGYGTLSGGVLNTSGEHIGYGGTAFFLQTGGVNNIDSDEDFSIAGYFTGVGTYTLTGGVITSAVPTRIGPVGNGTFNISGGILNTNGVSIVTTFFGSSGTLNFSGGTIVTPYLAIDGSASTLNWTGGTLQFTSNQTYDPLAGADVNNLAFNSALLLNSKQTLLVTGNETLGGTGAFSMELGAGSFHSVSGTLTVMPSSTLTQDAGSSLDAAVLIEQGTINGFLQNQGLFIYQRGAFNAELINQGTVNLGPAFTAGNGIENDAALTLTTGELITVNGLGLDNFGSFALGGATLSGSGPVVNDFSGLMTAHGAINNAFTNLGVLTIDGVLHLNGGGTNSGILTGSGTIFGNFSNSGGNIALASGNVLSISSPWTNAGLVTLSGGVLGGGVITNTSTIQGTGSVSAPVNNNAGVIRAGAGELDLLAAANTNGAGGQIQIPAGGTVLFTKGLATNGGSIDLTGGTFDNNNQPMTNSSTGVIAGNGTFRSGGLTNNGIFNLTGNSSIFGGVTNSSAGQIHVATLAADSFFGAVSNGGAFTVDSGSSATFFSTYTGGAIVNNGQITFGDNSTSGKISGTGTLSIGSSTALVKLRLNTGSGTSAQGSLAIHPGSTLDIGNNTVAINFGSPASDPVSTVVAQLTTGFNGALWTGAGIDSSTAAAGSPGRTLSVGYADGNTDAGTAAALNQIVVKYTLAGDANLDGLVNFGDLVAVIQNFNKANTDWAHGNFTYGSSTNFGDLVTVIQNFNKTLSPAGSSDASLGGSAIALTSSIEPTVVRLPEPGGLALAAAAGLLLARRRMGNVRPS